MMILLSDAGTSERQDSSSIYRYWLHIDDKTKPLAAFSDEHGYVNSTKVLNKIKTSLSTISHYSKADIKRNQAAVTLDLKSYPWVFDIVPAVGIKNYAGTVTHYLIPDGAGKWMRTDPRTDSSNMTAANVLHGGELLPVMRLLKHWNNRTYNKSRLLPYYFETLVLNTLKRTYKITSAQEGIKRFFDYGSIYLNSSCADPKRLGPNLDAGIDAATKQKIAAAMSEAATNAGYAIMYEGQGDHKTAIYWWGRVFGPEFPTYE